MWLTARERVTLLVLGGTGLLALGALIWQQQHPPLTVEPGPTPPYAQWDRQLDAARRVDINRAAAEELERLPQIGPAMAQRIVAYRAAHGSFHSMQQLLEVQGIGPKTLAELQDYVTVQ